MTIQELSRYRKNVARIACIQRQDTRWGTVEIYGEGTIVAQSEIEKLRAENLQIRNCINSVPDETVYRALMLYCVIGGKKTWEEVAASMGEPSGDTISKRVRRFLNSI